MKVRTINIPTIYDKFLDLLIKKNLIPSRSEAVRMATREQVENDLEFIKKLSICINTGNTGDLDEDMHG